MSIQQGKVHEVIAGLLGRGATNEEIEAELVQQGHDTRFAHDIVAEVSKLYYARRRTQGLAFILAGAAVCFVSCLLALTHTGTQEQLRMALYGLTSVGVGLAFWGFMKVF